MAYLDEWDVNTPLGTELRSLGDDRIRELKRALSERFATFFVDWPDGEPLSGRILVGARDQMPNPPVVAGQLYYADDTDELFASIASGGTFLWRGPIGSETGSAPLDLGQTFVAQIDHRALTWPSAGVADFLVRPRSMVVLGVRIGIDFVDTNPMSQPIYVSHLSLTAAGFPQADIITIAAPELKLGAGAISTGPLPGTIDLIAQENDLANNRLVFRGIRSWGSPGLSADAFLQCLIYYSSPGQAPPAY